MRTGWIIAIVIAVLVYALWAAGELSDILGDGSDGTGSTDANDNSSDGGTTGTTTVENFISSWARAIAPAENVNTAYNNPGGLNMQGDLGSVPAAGGTGNDVIGVFSSLDAGYAALEGVLQHYVNTYSDLTLQQATAVYVLGPNNPDTQAAIGGDISALPANVINEAAAVAQRLGVSVDSTLGSLAGK